MNASPLPPLDLILCRDVLSFMPPLDQKRLVVDFGEKLKPNGVVLAGSNERMGRGRDGDRFGRPFRPIARTRTSLQGQDVEENGMRVEYINPFVEAAFNVLREVLQADVRRGELYLKSTSMPVMGVAAIVGLAGDVEGRVLFDMAGPPPSGSPPR